MECAPNLSVAGICAASTGTFLAESVQRDQQGQPDAEDYYRYEEVAVGEDGASLVSESHLSQLAQP